MTKDRGFIQMLDSDYRSIDAYNFSTIKSMLPGYSPRTSLFDLREQSNNLRDTLTLGSSFHAALLEPEQFKSNYVVLDRRKKSEVSEATEDGKTVISHEMYRKICLMLEGISRNGLALDLLQSLDIKEHVCLWDNPETGLSCKAKIDGYSTKKGYLVDIKTSSDVPSFEKRFFSSSYDMQLAFYAEGILSQSFPVERVFIIAFDTVQPWDCVVIEIGPVALSKGCEKYSRILRRIKAGTVSREDGYTNYSLN